MFFCKYRFEGCVFLFTSITHIEAYSKISCKSFQAFIDIHQMFASIKFLKKNYVHKIIQA